MAKIFLHFYSGFPANVAGELIELNTDTKDNGKNDSFWTFGTIQYADVRMLPLKDVPVTEHYRSISRLHFTIKYDTRYNIWSVLDGAVYLDEKESQPGKFPIKSSANGVWHNGEKLRTDDWQTIRSGDLIYLGGEKKIIVRSSEYDTINDEAWLTGWKCGPKKPEDEKIPVKKNESVALKNQAKSNASPWTLLEQVFIWIKSPSRNKSESFMKLAILGSGLALALSTEIRDLIKWISDR